MIRNRLLGVVILLLSSLTLAAPYWGEIFEFKQPDGTLAQVKVYGDEYYQYVESLDGYTLVRSPETGWIEYAETNEDDSDFIATGVVYDPRQRTDPNHPVFNTLAQRASELKGKTKNRIQDKGPALKPGLRLRRQSVLQKVRENMKRLNPERFAAGEEGQDGSVLAAAGEAVIQPAVTGSVVGLTLLIDFSDDPATISQAAIESYCNQPGYTGYGNSGSVYDFFYDVSNGNLQYTNYVTPYYRAKNPRSYYEGDCSGYGKVGELIKEALVWLDDPAGMNFNFNTLSLSGTSIKCLNVLYAGGTTSCGWAKGLWPHASSYSGFTSNEGIRSGKYQMTNVGSSLSLGTYCHENGHMMCGYPDLYDYGYESRGAGNFCLMAYGGSSQNPVPPCGYMRWKTGWETVIEMTADPAGTLRQHTANSNVSFRYSNPSDSKEFFLIESRVKTGRNASFPDEGLVIWHIDENGSNDNEQMTSALHYKVSVEQADGLFQLESNASSGGANDCFHGGYKDAFDDFTLPNAQWWSGANSGLNISQISPVSGLMSFSVGNGKPVGYWKFDGNSQDSSGNSVILSGFNFTGNIWSADTDTSGVDNLDRCVIFDGVDDYASAPGIADSSPLLSVAFWLCADDLRNTIVADKFPAGSAGAGWRVGFDVAGRVHFMIGSGSNYTDVISSESIVTPGVWRHLACVYNAGTAEIWVNGQQVTQVTEISQTPASTETFVLGKSVAVPLGQNFAGKLDEVLVYISVLNDLKIASFPGLKNKQKWSLAGRWKLNETTGMVANDSSAWKRNGALSGGQNFDTNSTAGAFGQALSFDGVDDYVEIPPLNLNSNTLTITGWINPDGNQADRAGVVFCRGGTTVSGLYLRNTNELRYSWNDDSGSYNFATGLIVPSHKWSFVAMVIQPDKATVYFHDGTTLRLATRTAAHVVEAFDVAVRIGHDNAGSRYFKGSIDDVRMCAYSMTLDEIAALYKGGSSHSPAFEDNSVCNPLETPLRWQNNENSAVSMIYWGTDKTAVANATAASAEFKGYRTVNQFLPASQSVGELYYWRIDQILQDSTVLKGPLWSYSTGGSVTREVWTGLSSGNAVSDLTSIAGYPATPHAYESLKTFEAPTSFGEKYGQRLQALLIPQTSGSYTFWIASDDSSELWLSTNATPANAAKIAYVSGSTSSRQWTRYTTQQSQVRSLVAGQSYYLMAVHKEGIGGDNLAVAWRGPDCPTRSVIQGRFLRPYISKPAPLFISETIVSSDARETQSSLSQIGSEIVNAGDFTFSKAAGPSWLGISSNGSAAGTPARGEKGQHTFVVQAQDAYGRISQAAMQIPVEASYDGGMGLSDLRRLGENWLFAEVGNPSDLDNSNTVDIQDFGILSRNWQNTIIPGLLGWWKMDDAVLSTLRDSYGDHDAAVFNRPTDRGVPGKNGNAISFDGINGYAEITGFKGVVGTASRTCTAWIKTPGTAQNSVILGWGGQQWVFGLFGTGELTVYAGGPYIKTTRFVNDNRWHHVAAVMTDDGSPDAGEIKLYIDGLLQTTVKAAGAINTPQANDVLIGAFSAGAPAGFFNGLIDDVRIYDRALDGQEIAEIAWLSGLQFEGLVGYWALNESAGSLAVDSAATHNNGALINMDNNDWVAGKTGNALNFDGTNDYVEITGYKGVSGAASRTCAAWIKTPGTAQNSVILGWGGQQWVFGLFGTGELTVYAGGPYIKTTGVVNDNQWHHVAAVMTDDGSPDAGEIMLYVDGLLQTTANSPGVIDTPQTNDVLIGAFSTGTPAGFFNGLLDDVKIYNRALSGPEVLELQSF